MPSRRFSSGRIRQADYHPAQQQLDLHFDRGNAIAYKHVPEEVFRRLCSAPNPASYWEDRIAEEYPSARPRRAAGAPDAAQQFKDLFGGGD
jgi:hypothetical protein